MLVNDVLKVLPPQTELELLVLPPVFVPSCPCSLPNYSHSITAFLLH